jgi:hypothetical protein
MKICPVCNDSFPDELNFCDIDGSRLAREANQAGGAQGKDRGNWWSLLGAGLLVGAVVISAASIIFLPKARVGLPVVSSEPQSLPAASKAPAVDSAAAGSAATVAAATPASEPDTSAADVVAPELKKKDKVTANSNAGQAPNPKAAALAAEGVDGAASSRDADKNAASTTNKSEPPPASKPVSDTRPAETATKPAQAPVDVRREQKTTPVSAKSTDKGSDKKKSDDKEKKKGGFLRVFKKIFGKD